MLDLMNSTVAHHDYQCDRTLWAVSVCETVNSPRVKLLCDIYHMQIMEGDVIRTLRDDILHVGRFHTAGNPGRNELSYTRERFYPAIMQALAATDYYGFVGQELNLGNGANWAKPPEAAYRVCSHSI